MEYFAQGVIDWKTKTPLLQAIDRLMPPGFLFSLLLKEVEEVFPELGIDDEAARKELVDVLVFAFSYMMAFNLSKELFTASLSVNGSGAQSSSCDVLLELAKNLPDDGARGLGQVMAQSWSMMIHLPTENLAPALIAASETFSKVMEKVRGNRPADLYTNLSVDGKPLSDEECIGKYRFLEKCLRLLRNKVGRTLTTSDWIAYKYFLLSGWQMREDAGMLTFAGLLHGSRSDVGVYLVGNATK